jgi:histidinol-phosphate/aromatic aminotransferase/cobyric acid decarboxylase-like protein
MLVHVDSFTAKETCHLLLERYGLKVRDVSNHHSLDDHYIRITSQTTEVNNLLINALQELIHTS